MDSTKEAVKYFRGLLKVKVKIHSLSDEVDNGAVIFENPDQYLLLDIVDDAELGKEVSWILST